MWLGIKKGGWCPLKKKSGKRYLRGKNKWGRGVLGNKKRAGGTRSVLFINYNAQKFQAYDLSSALSSLKVSISIISSCLQSLRLIL